MEGPVALRGSDSALEKGEEDESLTVDTVGVGHALSNVQVYEGGIQMAGRDVNLHIHHHYPSKTDAEVYKVPSFLDHVVNFRDVHIDTLGKATSGTGDWIYVWDEFCIWGTKDGRIRMLWGTGMPGAGKTILASLAINHIEDRARKSSTPICVGYLYIRYSDTAKATLRDLLEVLVRQTVERHPASLPLCNDIYSRHVREKTQPSAQELFSLLKRFTSELEMTTFYFLDALDEAPAQVQLDLLEHLSSLNVKLFITSRPLKAVETRFPDAHHFSVVAQDADLETHIVREISRSSELQAILATATPGLEGRITLTVKQQCSGMFLHASLHLQALRECTSRYDLEKALHNFPPHIIDVYAQTWNRIKNQSSGKASPAMRVLLWLAYATRSLTVEELRHAVAVDPDTYKFECTRMVPLETLVSACCGLLVIEAETKIARLVHYTAAEALQGLIAKVEPHPHGLLAGICMGQLRETGLQLSSITSSEALHATLDSTPFLAYAYWAWSHHARESLDDETSRSRVSEFVQGCQAFPILPYKYGTFDLFGPLHVAAYFNTPPSLLPSSFIRDPNIPSREEALTPLHLTSLHNSYGAAKELLGLSNISVNASSKHGDTALRLASRYGAEGVIELLLSHPRSKVNQATKEGLTPLHAAAHAGTMGALKLLLAVPNINVNPVDKFGTTPLLVASTWGHTDTVRALVAHPKININQADKQGNTALIAAVMYAQDPDVVRALLAHPQINIDQRDGPDGDGEPAFYYARRWRGSRDEITGILLDAYRQRRDAKSSTAAAGRYTGDDGGPPAVEWLKGLALSLVGR